jgi:hypothetical protein
MKFNKFVKSFVSFDKFIAQDALITLYDFTMVCFLIFSLYSLIFAGSILGGIIVILQTIMGVFFIRIGYEVLLVIFTINENLKKIKEHLIGKRDKE